MVWWLVTHRDKFTFTFYDEVYFIVYTSRFARQFGYSSFVGPQRNVSERASLNRSQIS